jgi:hypothetical protein
MVNVQNVVFIWHQNSPTKPKNWLDLHYNLNKDFDFKNTWQIINVFLPHFRYFKNYEWQSYFANTGSSALWQNILVKTSLKTDLRKLHWPQNDISCESRILNEECDSVTKHTLSSMTYFLKINTTCDYDQEKFITHYWKGELKPWTVCASVVVGQ